MAKTGLIVGKFLPFHKGHLEFINRSLEVCDKLYILIDRKDIDGFNGIKNLTLDSYRIEWKFVEEYNPQTTKGLSEEDIDSFYFDYWIPTIQKYVPENIDYLCCTDWSYVSEFYDYLKIVYSNIKLFYYNRNEYCATRIRNNPWKYRDDIVGFKPKNHVFVFEGGESTGKTTLAQKLAKDLNGYYVPEYGREYALIKDPKDWTLDDWRHVANEQDLRIQIAAISNDLVIADTSSLTTRSFYYMYNNRQSLALNIRKIDWSATYSYFVFKPDVDFVQDGTRNTELNRIDHFNWFNDIVYNDHKIISGNYKQRELAVLNHMNKEFFK